MRQYPEVDAAFALRQIEGWQRAEHKLPELAAIEGWLWPKRLSLEQCSSQSTAVYKRQVLSKVEGGRSKVEGLRSKVEGQGEKGEEERESVLIDLTGGLGVDTYYLSEGFREVHYVERNEELCALAEKNFALAGKRIMVHCCEAETFLEEWNGAHETHEANEAHGANETTIFVDPARRDAHGGKVFRLEDCEPNVVAHLSILRACARRVLLKLSPMLDVTEALRALGGAAEVHVVAVRNEVKEVLVLLEAGRDSMDPEITCVNLETEEESFVFRKSEEDGPHETNEANGTNEAHGANEIILVEPNAAIMKAGAFRTFGERYGLGKLGKNSQLYVAKGVQRCIGESTERVLESYVTFCGAEGSKNFEYAECKRLYPSLPGRIFTVHIATKEELKNLNQANVICRNYPLSPEALKKKLRVRDGGEKYVIATKIGTKPVIFLGVRQFLHR